MSGIYFHIPFCKQLCHYCAFHKSISLQAKERMLNCLKKELKDRKDYLKGKHIDSIYFGGGTPSLLNESELTQIFETISKYFSSDAQTEITLEANPTSIEAQKFNRDDACASGSCVV